MSQFSLNPGAALHPAGARVQRADGTSETFKLPFGIGSLGDDVTSITLQDPQNREIQIRFTTPAKIRTDNAARIAFVLDRMEAGQSYPLEFEIKLPAPVTFYPGPQSVPSSTEGWFVFQGKSPIPAESE